MTSDDEANPGEGDAVDPTSTTPPHGEGAEESSTSSPRPVCDMCGAPAITHISNIVHGELQMRHLCAACTDALDAAPVSGYRRGQGSILILMGAFVTVLSLFADFFAFGRSAGFGWRQMLGMVLAGLIFLLGAVVRVPALIITGAAMGMLTLLADWLAFGSHPGFGWQQKIGTAIGLAMILAGTSVTRLKRNPRSEE
jgi:heme exporter protein D